MYSMFFIVSSVNLKDRNSTHIIFTYMLPIRLSDYRAVGLWGCRTMACMGLSDYGMGLSDYRAVGLWGCRTSERIP